MGKMRPMTSRPPMDPAGIVVWSAAKPVPLCYQLRARRYAGRAARPIQEGLMLRAGAVILVAAMMTGAGMAAPSPSHAQSSSSEPSSPPAAAVPAEPDKPLTTDPFGAETVLPERTVVVMQGSARWDSAFETLVDTFKSILGYLEKAGVKPNGPKLVIYTDTDDNGFKYKAAIPIADAPKDAPQGDLAVEPAPAGKVFKFLHRGSYDSMDNTYEAIANFLDQKGLDVKDLFIEEYLTDPVATPPDELVINVYVPTQ
jgi:effector-binding domain-containing protein